MHKEAFDALAPRRIEDITNNYGNVNQTVLNLLKELRRSPSHQVIQQILSLKEFCDFFFMFVTGDGHRFQMTMQYLKDASISWVKYARSVSKFWGTSFLCGIS